MVSHKRVSSRPEWNCWYSLFKTWQTRPGSPHCAMQWSSSPAPDPLEHFSLVFLWPRVSSFPVFWSVNYQFVGVWRKGCVQRVFFLKAFQIQDEKDLQMLKRRNFFFPPALFPFSSCSSLYMWVLFAFSSIFSKPPSPFGTLNTIKLQYPKCERNKMIEMR